MMTANETADTAAANYVCFDLGDDTGAIQWIAQAGTMKADDAAVIRVVYGSDADVVIAAIVKLCTLKAVK